ncbi:MAG: type VI secretion system tip protein VgrG [Chitinophagaceae bacterium]|nr:type VI secretion system tip protein VgrG [Chitinophagaceae bacterium]
MANTPFTGIEDPAPLIKIKLDGVDMSDSYGIQSINVHHAINRISTAELVLMGEVDIDSGNIPITDSDDFNPGNVVEIFAGYTGGEASSIFKGIIVKHTVKLDTESHYSFAITCKHEVVKMTYNKTERYFEKQTDDAVIKNIIGEYGISCSVGSCLEVNESMFQKLASDWDFILSRCDFNGFIITMDDNAGMVLNAPEFSDSAVLTIEAGVSLMAFEGTLNAEFQPSAVNASAWNAKTLTLINAAATEPAMNSQGNIKARDLPSKLSQTTLNLTSATPMTTEALKTWANSILLRKRLHAFKGRVKYFGNALAKTGSIIEIKGAGKKLSGNAFVSAITHTIDSGNWNTTVDFGLDNNLIYKSRDFSFPPAMGQLPAMQGLQLATVKQIDRDPENMHRIQLEIPSVSGTPNTTWARMAHYYASNKSGSFFLPEVGDEVVLGFLDNDPRYPIILGSLYNGKNTAPYTAEAKNNSKAFVTRSNMKIEFDEEKKSISLLTPGNNSIIISDDGKSIEIKDQNSNSIHLSSDGITIDSAKDIKISAKGNIEMHATGNIKTAATSDLVLQGLAVNINAQTQLKATGTASAEFSAAGETTIAGAMVMIN